ncbi:MAG: Asp-tRNA(Asn)/Glu-tRNA(Gln) amidotransferase subunit GatB, partial [Bdellovibrionales bacterium]|nr:Asp-tRNA(Asn)/Glu-tRNA(Gln) amidotransferase subunit GatB [Bdellovibrionales bacterium]
LLTLLEIVSKPDMNSPEEAAGYARMVRQILRYADVCDGNLEEGSMRCDCNVSARPKGQKELGTKVELKNLNSFRFIEKAIDFEIHRQIDLIESGDKVVQETRLYDSTKNKTFSMRSKEEAEDYRYFPDPDLLPLKIEEKKIFQIQEELPEMPFAKYTRFINEYQLSVQDALFLTEEQDVASYFEETVHKCKQAKMVANWIMTELYKELNTHKLSVKNSPITPTRLADLINLIDEGSISGKIAKKVFELMWSENKTADEILEEKGWKQVSNNNDIEGWVDEVIAQSPDQVAEYKSGKIKVLGFLMGQVMKLSKGQANPGVVQEILKEKLK